MALFAVVISAVLDNTDLPHTGLFSVDNGHVADFVPLDVQPLRLVQLLRHKAHERVIGGVRCQGQTKQLAKNNATEEKAIKLKQLLPPFATLPVEYEKKNKTA